MSSGGSHFFKDQANAQDLRAVQSAILWEWAVTTGLSLPLAAQKFCSSYRSFWPLRPMGDPLILDDRMFEVDERSVTTILRKLEERYGKYDAGSSTQSSTNMFQRLDFAKRPLNHPVWVRNTKAPRDHCEAILKKYGVPKQYQPSSAPGIRLTDFFRDKTLIANPEAAAPEDRLFDGALSLQSIRDSFSLALRPLTSPPRIGASPYRRAPIGPPSGRSIGGPRSPSRSPSPAGHSPAPRRLPPISSPGSAAARKHGTPSRGSPTSIMGGHDLSPTRRLFQ